MRSYLPPSLTTSPSVEAMYRRPPSGLIAFPSTYLRLREPPSPPSTASSREATYRREREDCFCTSCFCMYFIASLLLTAPVFSVYLPPSHCTLLSRAISFVYPVVSCSSLSHAHFLLSRARLCFLMLVPACSCSFLPSHTHCNSVSDLGSCLRLRLGVSPPSSTWDLNSVSESRRVLYSPRTIYSSSRHELLTFSTWALDVLDRSCRPS